MKPGGTPCRVPVLLMSCFTAQAKPDKLHTFAASGLEVCLIGCAGTRSDVFHLLSCGRAVCMEHAGLAAWPVLALLSLVMAGVGKC